MLQIHGISLGGTFDILASMTELLQNLYKNRVQPQKFVKIKHDYQWVSNSLCGKVVYDVGQNLKDCLTQWPSIIIYHCLFYSDFHLLALKRKLLKAILKLLFFF